VKVKWYVCDPEMCTLLVALLVIVCVSCWLYPVGLRLVVLARSGVEHYRCVAFIGKVRAERVHC